MRVIENLEFAERTTPRSMPRITGAMQKRGISFEKKVGVQLNRIASEINATVEHQPWFNFIDENGLGSAVPDFLFHFGPVTVVIEVKLSWVADAKRKLVGLYVPLVMIAQPNIAVRGLVICKNLRPECDSEIITNLEAAIHNPTIHVLHWIGTGRLPWMSR